MAKTDKTLERMRNNPRGWRIESLEAVAVRFGIVVRKPPGSHVVFQHEASVLEVSVPAHRPIKPVYVKQFLALIDDIRS
ncbi:MAG: type II toxin-antitoxin system HicA family toxin [Gammaproteobacteria bacterium]